MGADTLLAAAAAAPHDKAGALPARKHKQAGGCWAPAHDDNEPSGSFGREGACGSWYRACAACAHARSLRKRADARRVAFHVAAPSRLNEPAACGRRAAAPQRLCRQRGRQRE